MQDYSLAPAESSGMKQDFPPMNMDLSGVNEPQLISAAASGLQDEELVIGVVAFGESRAYLQSALGGLPERHIVNDEFGSIPVSITYCDRTRCTRVLTSDKIKGRLDMRCGGWLAIQEMALLLDKKRYPQSSQELPLQDLPFKVTTWKAWVSAQPNTLVYVGKNQEG